MFVCSKCSNVVEALTWRTSFKLNGQRVCGTCGNTFETRELAAEELARLRNMHKNWVGKRVIGGELIWLGVMLLLALGAGAAKVASQ